MNPYFNPRLTTHGDTEGRMTGNPSKPPYPFGWPTGKPGREGRKPKRKPARRKALTGRASLPHNAFALDASGAGPGNPILLRRTSANRRALFVCPVLYYGGLGGAGSRLAGSLTPVFQTRSSRHPSALESQGNRAI